MFLAPSRANNPERERESQPLLRETSSNAKRDNDTDNVKAWLVALGIFFINFTIQGMGRIAGLLYMDFMAVFHVNREVASEPYSAQQSVRMLVGPLVGILAQRFGIRFVKVLGCVIAAGSCAACYFAKDINTITILWGAVYGVGTALAATVNLVLIDQYFVRHKSTASGFVFSGTSAGALILPAALSSITEKYGMPGTFLLMGSIILYVIPIAMVLKEKPTSKSKATLEGSYGTSSKFSSLPEAESSFDSGSKTGGLSKRYGTKEGDPADDIVGTGKFLGTEDLKTSTPKASLEKRSGEKDAKDPGSQSKKSRRKSSKKSKKGQGETVSVTFKESRSSGGSNVESSIELATKTNPLTKKESLRSVMHSKEDSPEGTKEESTSITDITEKDISAERAGPSEVIKNIKSNLESQLFTDTTQSKGQAFDDVKGVIPCVETEYEKFVDIFVSPKRELKSSSEQTRVTEERVAFSEEYKDEKRVEKESESGDYRVEAESSLEKELKGATEDRYLINFDILHENSDLVLDLLANKIPLNDEEVMPSASEITQSNLESSDTLFLARELKRLEQNFQLPVAKREKFLCEIQAKLRKFNEVLDADRNKFLNQKKEDFEGKQLVYKDIHSTTIKKPDCTIEITEYSFEIPVELYIPVKLQELNERSSTYVASYYSEDPRVFVVLTELRKLHYIFSKPPQSAKYSSESSSFQYKSFSGKIPIGEYRNTFRNHIRTSILMHGNPMFLLVCLCRGLYTLAFVPVVTSVVDFAMDKSMAEKYELYPILAVSFGDLIGRLCSGWITDKGFISDKNFMVIFLILQGISTAALPQLDTIALMPALVVFAVLQGSLFMKHPIVLMKYLRTHEKYIGLGFMNLLSGILGLIIPIYIGYFRDTQGSYDMIFYINGGISGILGLLWLFEPLLVRFVPKMREGGDDFVTLLEDNMRIH